MQQMGSWELLSAEEVLTEQLGDAEFRAEWERSALAQSVALSLVGYRIEHRLSQRRLGWSLGMSQPAIALLESGDDAPTADMLAHITKTLGIQFPADVMLRRTME
jgi:DNA-binding XRE family transcriptional regulator